MEVESRSQVNSELATMEAFLNWKARACRSNTRGGTRAVIFVLGLQTFEMMAVAAVGNNLITYVFHEMHFPLSRSANIVTNFIGTVFLLSLVGGFLSDCYLGSFWTMLIFGFVELSGFILLSLQAHLPTLRPAECNMMTGGEQCLEAKGLEAITFFVAIYLVAMGSGCLKPNMISHGADQFTADGRDQSKKLSTYFNTAYFSFCLGELVALTVFVWIQTQYGMDIGFGVSAAAMGIGLLSLICGLLFYRNKPPQGSIYNPLSRVFLMAITKRKQICPSNAEVPQENQNDRSIIVDFELPRNTTNQHQIDKFKSKDKSWKIAQECNSSHAEGLCTMQQVEQMKIILSVIPIFACTIIFNTILAQLQTFSVQQGSSMDTRLTNEFRIPPASLQSIPYIMLMVLVPLYEVGFVPFARKITGNESGISPLQRVGVGLFTVTFSMVSAALVENKRRKLFVSSSEQLSIFWIAPQFLIFGLSEMFTAVGLIEFFYKQPTVGMQSFLTAMTYCSYSFGFYVSSLLVSAINKITSSGKNKGGWLGDNDLNRDRLDLFYWMLAGLSLLNFFNYLFWSRRYSHRKTLELFNTNSTRDHTFSMEQNTALALQKQVSNSN